MYDNTCRFLAENFFADFASWLLGEPIPLTELKPSEFSLEPIRSEGTLRQVAERLEQVSDPTTQMNLSAASAILAGLRLEEEIVYRILRKDIMKESSVYRAIQAEGKAERSKEIALNFLRRGLSIEVVADGTGLSIEEIQQLQERSTQENRPAQN